MATSRNSSLKKENIKEGLVWSLLLINKRALTCKLHQFDQYCYIMNHNSDVRVSKFY